MAINNSSSKRELYHKAVKCIYCREPCDMTDGSSTPSESCRRCAKNELKYGKPSVCHYCQLPAAFVGKLCQLCAHYAKRYGRPSTCRHCKLKAAFVKRPAGPAPAAATTATSGSSSVAGATAAEAKKSALCRLCKFTYDKSLAAATTAQRQKEKRKLFADGAGSTIGSAAKKRPWSEQGSTSSTVNSHTSGSVKNVISATLPVPTNKFDSSYNSSSIQQAKETLNEHVLTVTQLKDEVLSLKKQLQSKDQEIFERDKKVADLKAQALKADRDCRSRITELQKQHENTLEILQEKIKILSKELSSVRKNTGKDK